LVERLTIGLAGVTARQEEVVATVTWRRAGALSWFGLGAASRFTGLGTQSSGARVLFVLLVLGVGAVQMWQAAGLQLGVGGVPLPSGASRQRRCGRGVLGESRSTALRGSSSAAPLVHGRSGSSASEQRC
jgi:hypothetical protein